MHGRGVGLEPAAADRAFAGAAREVSLTVVNQRIVANYLDTRAAIAEYDAGADRLTLTLGSQGSHAIRDVLCGDVLKIPSEKLRVVVTSDGAALRSVQLKGEKFQRRKPGTKEVSQVDLVEPQPGLPLPLATALRDGSGADLVPADAGYELVRHDERSAVFRAVAGGVTVLKTFTLDPRLYRLDLVVEVRSEAQLSGQLAVLSTGHGEAPSFTMRSNDRARAEVPPANLCAASSRACTGEPGFSD